MTRKKVDLVYITNDSARKATFRKRKQGLMKKVRELSALCGIDACAIIYSPFDPQAEVWPCPSGVQRVLQRFRMLPEMDQAKKMMNQESFLRQRIAKAADHLEKQCRNNREKEMIHLMFQCLVGNAALHHLNLTDLNDLGWVINQHLREITCRKERLKRAESQSSQATAAQTAAAAVDDKNHQGENVDVDTADVTNGLHMNATNSMAGYLEQQWFPYDSMSFGGEETILPPFPDSNQNPTWLNSLFP